MRERRPDFGDWVKNIKSKGKKTGYIGSFLAVLAQR